MPKQPFTAQQIFSLKLETLEQRIWDFYQETQDSTMTLKLILSLRVRYQLGAEEFALVLKDLVRQLFLQTKATRTMKRYFYCFAEYFEDLEWAKLGVKLFPVRKFVEKAKSVIGAQIARFLPAKAAVP